MNKPLEINLQINNQPVTQIDDGDRPLVWLLREQLKLTKTKISCGLGQCGACTVLLDGQPVRSCITPINTLQGKQVTTIEGLTAKAAVMQAWRELKVPRCQYCHVGQLMAATALLDETSQPDSIQIDAAMNREHCQCGTAPLTRQAISRAAELISQQES